MILTKSIPSFRGFLLKNVDSHISLNPTQSHNLPLLISRTFKSLSTKSTSKPWKTKTNSHKAHRSTMGLTKRGINSPKEVNGSFKGLSSLLRPTIFTVAVGGLSFSLASIWQYENLFMSQPKKSNSENRIGWLGAGVKKGDFRQQLNHWWNALSQGEKSVACIIGLNCVVLLLWRLPQIQPIMIKYFTASPMASTTCLPMLLSTFSHHSALHLLANMYVLWSFAPSITRLLGNEQFVATYITAGVVSSLGSYAMKILNKSMIPSIGASGAIMAVLGMVCVKYPDSRLSIALVSSFYPHSFSAITAMKGLIAVDVLGVLFRWKLFDHAAHLAGIFFGIWYVNYGSKITWQKRKPLVDRWHSLRSGEE